MSRSGWLRHAAGRAVCRVSRVTKVSFCHWPRGTDPWCHPIDGLVDVPLAGLRRNDKMWGRDLSAVVARARILQNPWAPSKWWAVLRMAVKDGCKAMFATPEVIVMTIGTIGQKPKPRNQGRRPARRGASRMVERAFRPAWTTSEHLKPRYKIIIRYATGGRRAAHPSAGCAPRGRNRRAPRGPRGVHSGCTSGRFPAFGRRGVWPRPSIWRCCLRCPSRTP